MDLQKRTWAEISLSNIEHNYNAIRKSLPEKVKFLGVVKADAYGHGAVSVSRRLCELGADYLAVSCLDEAMELRQNGISMPVLILGHTPSQYTDILIENNITQTVTCYAKAAEYSKKKKKSGGTLKIHIKLDTGMGRLGFLCAGNHFENGVSDVAKSVKMEGLYAEGIFTHFSVSDEPGEDNRKYTLSQFKLFTDVIKALSDLGIQFEIRHCANSGATVNYPETALDMVRPGLLLYGYGDGGKLGLRPVMSLITTVSTIKHYEGGIDISYGRTYTTEGHRRLGVLPVGYADGLLRSLSNRCSFYTPYGMAPQRGKICMDMCMVDLTDLPQVNIDSHIEIFGAHGSLEKLAEQGGTIPYELMCSVSKRVPRVYMG